MPKPTLRTLTSHKLLALTWKPSWNHRPSLLVGGGVVWEGDPTRKEKPK